MSTLSQLQQRLAQLEAERRRLREIADLNGPLAREIAELRAEDQRLLAESAALRARGESDLGLAARFSRVRNLLPIREAQLNQARTRLAEISEDIGALRDEISRLEAGAGPDPQAQAAPPPSPPPPPLVAAPPQQTDPPEPAAKNPPPAEPPRPLNRGPDNSFVVDPNTGELVPGNSVQAQEILAEEDRQIRVRNELARDIGGDFVARDNIDGTGPGNVGSWYVENAATGEIVAVNLTQQEAILQAQERSVGDPGYGGLPRGVAGPPVPTQAQLRQAEFQTASERAEAALKAARDQATLAEQRKMDGTAAGDGDWRVRLRLGPSASYLYKTPGINTAGILEPLRETDGVIFPYTPRIEIAYSADYSPYDLTHNNYRGYFYKGSKVGEVILTATFTAQDTREANYMLATIHFFKSCTKMFYGLDTERGSPPPLVYLSGLGEFQFNEHACVISSFNYALPQEVDYIRARSTMASSAGVTQGGQGLLWKRSLAPSATASYSLSSIWSRLTGANVPQGAVNYPPAPPNLGKNSPTYVPTKLEVTLTLLPIQSRQQVSQQFSLKEYANGNLLKGGFW